MQGTLYADRLAAGEAVVSEGLVEVPTAEGHGFDGVSGESGIAGVLAQAPSFFAVVGLLGKLAASAAANSRNFGSSVGFTDFGL
jgi:hypothetical protein